MVATAVRFVRSPNLPETGDRRLRNQQRIQYDGDTSCSDPIRFCFRKVPADVPYTKMECFIDLKDGSRAMEAQMDTTNNTKMSAEVCASLCLLFAVLASRVNKQRRRSCT